MNLKEALKENEQLKKQNQALITAYEESQRLLFELNEKLNHLLKDKENMVEKYTIERIKKFIQKTEVTNPVIIHEVETLVKEKKVRKEKSKNFENFDFERHVSERDMKNLKRLYVHPVDMI